MRVEFERGVFTVVPNCTVDLLSSMSAVFRGALEVDEDTDELILVDVRGASPSTLQMFLGNGTDAEWNNPQLLVDVFWLANYLDASEAAAAALRIRLRDAQILEHPRVLYDWLDLLSAGSVHMLSDLSRQRLEALARGVTSTDGGEELCDAFIGAFASIPDIEYIASHSDIALHAVWSCRGPPQPVEAAQPAAQRRPPLERLMGALMARTGARRVTQLAVGAAFLADDEDDALHLLDEIEHAGWPLAHANMEHYVPVFRRGWTRLLARAVDVEHLVSDDLLRAIQFVHYDIRNTSEGFFPPPISAPEAATVRFLIAKYLENPLHDTVDYLAIIESVLGAPLLPGIRPRSRPMNATAARFMISMAYEQGQGEDDNLRLVLRTLASARPPAGGSSLMMSVLPELRRLHDAPLALMLLKESCDAWWRGGVPYDGLMVYVLGQTWCPLQINASLMGYLERTATAINSDAVLDAVHEHIAV